VRGALAGRGDREPLLDDLGNFMSRRDQLEYAPVDLPVTELLGAVRVVAQVRDVQAIGEIVQHDAGLSPERADRPRLIEGLYIGAVHLLAPVAGRWLETQDLRRRTGREQDHAGFLRADAGLEGRPLIASKQPVSHLVQIPSAGLSQTCPSYRAMKSARPWEIR
jgi:hypothetical protein